MCGIVAQAGRPSEELFASAMALTKHRGIRHDIKESAGGLVGHVRLPIVGLGEGFDQPVHRITGGDRWTIAFVGEVLDFRERDPRAVCDLNTVTRAWMQRGPSGLVDHDGFWGVTALSDNGNLHVLCDYLGQKPMYYRADVRAAASELDAIAVLGPVTPDEVYLSAVVKWGYCPDVSRTPYQEVKHVLPGEHVVIQENGQVRRRIADPLTPVGCTLPELKLEIEAAIRRRVLSSDVPVACLLSGGLDSSIVYTVASRHGVVRPYYVEDKGHPDNMERLRVSSVVERARAGAKYQSIDWSHVGFVEALRIMQEPIDLGSLIPQVAMSRAVQERVCLTGDGADECFGGYGRSQRYDSQGSDLFQELPAWHLPRLDRVMMRHQVETRSPFLARRVVQMAMGLPHRSRVDKDTLRYLFANDLPPGIAYAKKIPLRTPTIEAGREANSATLVHTFRSMKWPEKSSPAIALVGEPQSTTARSSGPSASPAA